MRSAGSSAARSRRFLAPAGAARDRLVVVAGGGQAAVLAHEQPGRARGGRARGPARRRRARGASAPPRARGRAGARAGARARAGRGRRSRASPARRASGRGRRRPAANSRSRSARSSPSGSGPPSAASSAVTICVLEPVDAGDHAAQQHGRVAGEVVEAQRQLVDALEQHGQAVGGRRRGDERVEAGLERLVVQQPRAEPVDGVDGELVEAAVQLVLDRRAQAVGGGLRRGHGEDGLGRQAAAATPARRGGRRARGSCRCPRRRRRAAARRGGSTTPLRRRQGIGRPRHA